MMFFVFFSSFSRLHAVVVTTLAHSVSRRKKQIS
jgi:hypothetical protein